MSDQPPSTSPADDPWLTVQQVSDELKIHPATVRGWVKSGRLAAVRAGRTWRVRRSEVDRALMSDPSPAYQQQNLAAPVEVGGEPVRRSAPRQIAAHILTVSRSPGEEQ